MSGQLRDRLLTGITDDSLTVVGVEHLAKPFLIISIVTMLS